MNRIYFLNIFLLFLILTIPSHALPIEVKIKGISDNILPTIVAVANFTNNGFEDEYRYEYCIVSNLEDKCENSIYRSSETVFIPSGQSWITDLILNIRNPGEYWFKVNMYYGSEKSTDSIKFEAYEESVQEEFLPPTVLTLAIEGIRISGMSLFKFAPYFSLICIFIVFFILYKKKKEERFYRIAKQKTLTTIANLRRMKK